MKFFVNFCKMFVAVCAVVAIIVAVFVMGMNFESHKSTSRFERNVKRVQLDVADWADDTWESIDDTVVTLWDDFAD